MYQRPRFGVRMNLALASTRVAELGHLTATRWVARAIFMGTAPVYNQENKGLDDKQINLGVVQPGERPAIFSEVPYERGW